MSTQLLSASCVSGAELDSVILSWIWRGTCMIDVEEHRAFEYTPAWAWRVVFP